MNGISPKLSPKKQRAIIALLEQPSIQKAATVAGIGETTLHRWLNDKAFKDSFRAAKQQIVTQAISRLQSISGKAVTALVDILDDKNHPPSTRVTAAKAVLEMATKFIEIQDLQHRLEEIEKALKNGDIGK